MQLGYSATLTGAAFMLFELKQVLILKQLGFSDEEIKEKVLAENLFQYTVKASIKRSIPSVFRRAEVLDSTLCKMLLEHSLETSKIINIYAIMKTDRLFFEFMNEVIRDKWESDNYLFEKKDLNLYFIAKAEQDTGVAGWTEQTVSKLKNVIQRILLGSGILKDKKTGELNRILLDEQLKQHLVYIGDIIYVRAMGE
ncbi:Putative inner membrane protein [Paenibacillaceae bacterium GAS479]|nr:Putative inner membrane protein [Paenibacillaceae bacterium GAS479]